MRSLSEGVSVLEDWTKWLNTRQNLLSALKAQVGELLGDDPAELKNYSRSYNQEFESGWSPSTKQKLFDSIIQSQLVIGGDFHAFAQSQRSHLRLLRSLPPNCPIIIGLECFEAEDQNLVDQYMRGELREKDFLNLIAWKEKWGFPWEHYRPLIQLASQKGFKIRGINKFFSLRSQDTLKLRDEYTADVIFKIREAFPKHLIYCLFGDLHLAENHLPRAIREKFQDSKTPITVVFQNSESLYFSLAKKKMEGKVEVLSKGPQKFCLMGSPPWVKWQSYLIYLEHTFDYDLEEDDDESLDFTDHIHTLVNIISTDLEVKVSADELAVYTPSDELPFAERHSNKNPHRLEILEGMVETERSFYLCEEGFLYLSRFSSNHAAALAGFYVHFQLMKNPNLPIQFPNDFIRFIWIEAISFFFSKWINHNRKADSLRELRAKFHSASGDKNGRESMLLALDQRMIEMLKVVSGKNRERRFSPKNNICYLEASKILGSILGEKMYIVYKEGGISKSDIRDILKFSIESPNFKEFYYQQISRFESPETQGVGL